MLALSTWFVWALKVGNYIIDKEYKFVFFSNTFIIFHFLFVLNMLGRRIDRCKWGGGRIRPVKPTRRDSKS